MFSLLSKIFGTANERLIKKLQKEVIKINALENHLLNLTDNELRAKTVSLKLKLSNGQSLDDITYEAFAIVKEVAKRVLNQKHYDVQLIGGLILHRGMIVEMRTGEGKTLVATLPAYLNALTGKGVYIVTVNDYLAKRDCEWMGKIFTFLGLTVSYVISGLSDDERQAAYSCDITYITNHELGFDYLRDNMKLNLDHKTQRPLHYAIIDEVDSILIDEARTPLVISGPVNDTTKLHKQINEVVKHLTKQDYEIDEKAKSVILTDIGTNHIESILIKNNLILHRSSLYDDNNLPLVHYINQSLRAHFIFFKDVDYLVKNKKVMIIDEFTGRIMKDRRYSDGLHQALEAKENVPIQKENQTLASITFQNYFRMYHKLSGMTGTAMTEAGELKDIYNLDVISVPTHNIMTRIDYDDAIYGTQEEKYQAVINLIKQCYTKGQPVLVGTISIEKSEKISKELTKHSIKHHVLNAKMHEQEADIIAQAGRYRNVTIATNMAGRGTDIMLGGNPEIIIKKTLDHSLSKKFNCFKIVQIKNNVLQEKKKVIEAGGLYVIGTERHESRRIDNQLRGRSGRQGDPGETKFFLSLEDDLMRIFSSPRTSTILRTLGLKNGEAIHHPIISLSLQKAQQKVEAHNYEIRKNLLKFDDVMNNQRQIIYTQRNDILLSNDISVFIQNIIKHLCEDIISNAMNSSDQQGEPWNISRLNESLLKMFSLNIDPDELSMMIQADKTQLILSLEQKIKSLLHKKEQEYGNNTIKSAARYLLITTLDQLWQEHLHNLDYLRQGIQLRAYGQRDPLNEYKKEAFNLFQNMLDRFRSLFIHKLCFLQITTENINQQTLMLSKTKLHGADINTIDSKFKHVLKNISVKAKPYQNSVPQNSRNPINPESWGKISRNTLCPCKSGKKYKHCHGREG